MQLTRRGFLSSVLGVLAVAAGAQAAVVPREVDAAELQALQLKLAEDYWKTLTSGFMTRGEVLARWNIVERPDREVA